MKRLLTLIFSAVLLCPMWAWAQTTPTIAGTLTWKLNPGVTNGTTTVYPPLWQGNCSPPTETCYKTVDGYICNQPVQMYPSCSVTGSVTVTQIVATVISNGNNSYLLSGQATIYVQASAGSYHSDYHLDYPGFGGMFLSGDSYIMSLMAATATGTYNMQCTISSTTLNGTCVGYNGSTSPITLVTN